MNVSPEEAASPSEYSKAFAVFGDVGCFSGSERCWGRVWLGAQDRDHTPDTHGSFAVGRVIYDWTDDANLDALAPVPGTKRELLVWIWYPSPLGIRCDGRTTCPLKLRAPARPASGPLIFRLLKLGLRTF